MAVKGGGLYDKPCAIVADAYGHPFVLNYHNRLQGFEVNGSHINICKVQGIYTYCCAKGHDWYDGSGMGKLAIANGRLHNAFFFDGQ